MRIKTRKIGRFSLSWEVLTDLQANEATNIFSQMFILQASDNWASGTIDYVAIHPDFDELREGESAPLYRVEFKAGDTTPIWKKA